jgi:hypothetical protein
MSVVQPILIRMDERPAKIDDVISTVFGVCTQRSTGVRRARIQQVEADLRAFLELTDGCALTAGERTLLAAEREFAPEGAVCRLFSANQLIEALPGFIAPPFLAPDLLLRHAQLTMFSALIEFLVPAQRYDHSSDRLRKDLGRALAQAKRDLQREREAQWHGKLLAQLSADQLKHMERLRREFNP